MSIMQRQYGHSMFMKFVILLYNYIFQSITEYIIKSVILFI